MSVGAWIRSLFSSVGPDDEATEREEFGLADRGLEEIERDQRSPDFATAEGADLARSEIEALGRPPGPDP